MTKSQLKEKYLSNLRRKGASNRALLVAGDYLDFTFDFLPKTDLHPTHWSAVNRVGSEVAAELTEPHRHDITAARLRTLALALYALGQFYEQKAKQQ